ncbi:MAG TPA: signal peptidase I [Candidatus Limnocylindrales bacterium]|nr:signal peptidase I [Candidatus Limnocylindrales bacterium]
MRTLARATATTRRLLDAVLIVVILVVVFGVVLAKVVPLTGRQTIIVGGRSMEPAIAIGAAIVVTPVAASELRVGDVISLRAGEDKALFTHRIIEIDQRTGGLWIHTKGDANPSPDPAPVPAADVEGRVDLAIPLAGYLIALLSIPTGVLFLIGLAATLLAAVWLLESLELDQVDRIRVELSPDSAPRLGEPISTRTLAGDSGFGSGRLTVDLPRD